MRLNFQRYMYRTENVFRSRISWDTEQKMSSKVYISFSTRLVVVFFSLCNLLLSISWAAPLTLKNTGQWLEPFLCFNCFTNTLKYYRKNYRFCKGQCITVSVKCKTDLKLFCHNHPGCVCSIIYWRFIQNKTHLVEH